MLHVAVLVEKIRKILGRAKKKLTRLEDGGDIVKRGSAFGDLLNDTDIRADHVIGKFLLKEFSQLPDVARVTVEGFDDFDVRTGPGLWICADPVDGSLNYKTRGNLIGNPYTAVVTVLSKVEGATFDDVICAIVLDLRPKSSDVWCAWREGENLFSNTSTGILATSRETKLDPGSQVIMTETYYPANRKALLKLFHGYKGNFSRLGSAAYEMAMVSSGNAIAFLCCSQKNHELGATQLLVRAGGGVAVDWEGDPIGLQIYDFRDQTPIILAANQSIADELVDHLHRMDP